MIRRMTEQIKTHTSRFHVALAKVTISVDVEEEAENSTDLGECSGTDVALHRFDSLG
jgi:hypothetical protein